VARLGILLLLVERRHLARPLLPCVRSSYKSYRSPATTATTTAATTPTVEGAARIAVADAAHRRSYLAQSTTMDASYYFLSNVRSVSLSSTDLARHGQRHGPVDDDAAAAAACLARQHRGRRTGSSSSSSSSSSVYYLFSTGGAVSYDDRTRVCGRTHPIRGGDRRVLEGVALQLPFGTGGSKDHSVLIVIGDDNDRKLSRGQRVLGKDALLVAIVLFGWRHR
jgi:hypothetical protein